MELCRKLNGYAQVGISDLPDSSIPPLRLPPNEMPLNLTKDALIQKMVVPHQSLLTKGNSFDIPYEWIEATKKSRAVAHIFRMVHI